MKTPEGCHALPRHTLLVSTRLMWHCMTSDDIFSGVNLNYEPAWLLLGSSIIHHLRLPVGPLFDDVIACSSGTV